MIEICVFETVFTAYLNFQCSLKQYQHWPYWRPLYGHINGGHNGQNWKMAIIATMDMAKFWNQHSQYWYRFKEYRKCRSAKKTVSKMHISMKSYGQKKPRTKIKAISFVFWANFEWNKGFLKAALPVRVQSLSLCFWNQEVKRNGNR